jgi:aminopeptidase N
VHMRRILFSLLIISTMAFVAQAQVTHYSVKLIPDFGAKVLRGEETIEFRHDAGKVAWQKMAGVQISGAKVGRESATVADESASVLLRDGGSHVAHIKYTATAGQGIEWFADKSGFETEFYSEAWMVCDTRLAERATLTLEIVLPVVSGMRAVGPGDLKRQWRDKSGEHFLFEQSVPVQTYLFSFGAGKVNRFADGKFIVYAADAVDAAANKSAARAVFGKSADAYSFLRGKAGVDMPDAKYTQAFLPGRAEQEAGGMALMHADYLPKLEDKDNVYLMAHEMAHQWWGVLVGIRSWQDFWLNEGMADFMTDAYVEQHLGRAAYDARIAAAKKAMEQLREQRKDRPLHWDERKSAHEPLGPIPYIKGALFLDRLRTELGDEKFWRGIALYTTRNAGKLVDTGDFERAMEEASGRDLKALFDEGVYH